MKTKIFACLISVLILWTALFGMSSCSFLSDIIEILPEIIATDAPDMPETPEPGPEETPQEDGSIPFRHTPDIGDYTMPSEDFADSLEREAAEIIDGAIAKALSYVEVMKDGRHSAVSYPFDENAGGYVTRFTDSELDFYRRIVASAKKIEPFNIADSEFPGGGDALKEFYFKAGTVLSYCEPGINSYLTLDVEVQGRWDYSTYYSKLFDRYFDPYRDFSSSVSDGSVTMAEVRHGADLLDRVVKRVVRFMPEGLSAYDKYYYLAAVLSEKVSYDKRPDSCFSAFGALVCGKAVCEGYASAYYLLCREANLWCAYRDGLPEGQGHAWNMIKLDSGIYNVDVTWCDGYGKPFERDWYDCFVKSDEVFVADGHCAEAGVPGTGVFEPSPYEARS